MRTRQSITERWRRTRGATGRAVCILMLSAALYLAGVQNAAGVEPDSVVTQTPSVLTQIARAGLPLILVEKEDGYTWRTPSDADHIHTVKLATDHLERIRNFWKGRGQETEPYGGPVLQMTVDWDTVTGTYTLTRIELGFFGKRFWIFHEQRDIEEKYGTLGIEIKKEW